MIGKTARTAARTAPKSTADSDVHFKDRRSIDRNELDKIFSGIGQKLREGRSNVAETTLVEAIQNYKHSDDDLANLKRLLAFTCETVGRYKESLDAIKAYEDEEILSRLSEETQIRVSTQLAIAFNNLGDHPKAVTLLKATHENAKENGFENLLGNIEIGLARVYRKLNECHMPRSRKGRSRTNARQRRLVHQIAAPSAVNPTAAIAERDAESHRPAPALASTAAQLSRR